MSTKPQKVKLFAGGSTATKLRVYQKWNPPGIRRLGCFCATSLGDLETGLGTLLTVSQSKPEGALRDRPQVCYVSGRFVNVAASKRQTRISGQAQEELGTQRECPFFLGPKSVCKVLMSHASSPLLW